MRNVRKIEGKLLLSSVLIVESKLQVIVLLKQKQKNLKKTIAGRSDETIFLY